jgi:putative phosphoribosyl transferase
MPFRDRAEAGARLAARLLPLGLEHPVILALPRGGVPVAAVVARALHAPLDVALVRKLGVPYQPELAVGAIGEGGVRVLNEDVRRAARVSDAQLAEVEAAERAELDRRAAAYRRGRPPLPIAGRTVVVVDDGIATGSTAEAACRVARARGAARIVVATPVAPPASIARLRGVADEVVCVEVREPFYAIGQWYDDFSQTSDAEVVALLAAGATAGAGPASGAPAPDTAFDEEVSFAAAPGDVELAGRLTVPAGALGVVAFAHGSGSSRHSPRNEAVAHRLQHARLATLLFDLLTPREAADRRRVFDIPLLAERLWSATEWLRTTDAIGEARIGYFGASTGAAAALAAAARGGDVVGAVVSRGGRPDLAGDALGRVRSPTLLVVGERDPVVVDLNRQALDELRCEKRMVVVPGATHLFEEAGTLEVVADLARDWFVGHLRPGYGDAP